MHAPAPLKSGKKDPNVNLVYPKSLNRKDIDTYNQKLDKHRIKVRN